MKNVLAALKMWIAINMRFNRHTFARLGWLVALAAALSPVAIAVVNAIIVNYPHDWPVILTVTSYVLEGIGFIFVGFYTYKMWPLIKSSIASSLAYTQPKPEMASDYDRDDYDQNDEE